MCRQFIVLCRELNLFSQALVAIDGSKFKAVNNRDKNFTAAKMKRRMAAINESIERYLTSMDTSQPLHDDDHEQALLKRELDAFERRQRALNAVTDNCHVYENGGLQPGKGAPPSRAALDAFKAADAEWRAALAECERVIDEIGVAS